MVAGEEDCFRVLVYGLGDAEQVVRDALHFIQAFKPCEVYKYVPLESFELSLFGPELSWFPKD